MKFLNKLGSAGLVATLLLVVSSNSAFATDPSCSDCDGKIDTMIMRYDGTSGAFVEVNATKGKRRSASVFAGSLSTGQQFVLSGAQNYLDRKGTLGPTITIRVDGVTIGTLHTSCSQPIGPGTTLGDFVVIAATSRNGGLTCPVGPIPDPPCNPRDPSCTGSG